MLLTSGRLVKLLIVCSNHSGVEVLCRSPRGFATGSRRMMFPILMCVVWGYLFLSKKLEECAVHYYFQVDGVLNLLSRAGAWHAWRQ